jgi:hypothetical protein
MRIELKYSAGVGPSPIEISQEDIDIMRESRELKATQQTPSGTRTVIITGTFLEFATLAAALLNEAV